MRQRVSVARALAMDPQVLLLDEPLGALDALTRATLQDEIVRIWEQDRKTVVLITNDVDEGILLADRIIPLSAGPGRDARAVGRRRPRRARATARRSTTDPQFKEIRQEVIGYLLGDRRQAAPCADAATHGRSAPAAATSSPSICHGRAASPMRRPQRRRAVDRVGGACA